MSPFQGLDFARRRFISDRVSAINIQGAYQGVEGGLPPMDWHPFQSYPILLKYATETKISSGAVNHSSKTVDLARFRFLFDFL